MIVPKQFLKTLEKFYSIKEKFYSIKSISFLSLPIVYFLISVFYLGKTLPNTYFGGENISGSDYSNVSHVVFDKVDTFWENKIRFVVANNIIEVDPISLGFQVDKQATVGSIEKWGKSGNLRDDFLVLVQSPFVKSSFSPSIKLDSARLSSTLDSLLTQYERPAVEPSIVFERGVPKVTAEEHGWVVDRTKLMSDLVISFEDLSSEPIKITLIEDTPKSTFENSLQALDRYKLLQSQTITLNFEKDSWTLTGKKLADLIRFYPEGYEWGYFLRSKSLFSPITIYSLGPELKEEARLQMVLDKDELDRFILEIAKRVDRPTVNATLKFERGKVTEFIPASDGLTLNEDLAKKLILEKVSVDNTDSEANILIGLPVEVKTAAIANEEINSLGIKTLIGKGISYFAGSIPNRISNLSLAAKRISGTLVAPGEVFSFNKSVGEVSGASGYKQAYVISQGRTILDDGGGVCQISSTIFRAALNSGLPIVSRTAHAYRVGYYEQAGFKPGFDATVWSPAVDFQFKNDTDHHILVQIVVDSAHAKAEVDIYGTSDGRKVEISDPVLTNYVPALPEIRQDDPSLPKGTVKQVDFAASGITSVFGRKVFKEGELIIDEKFTSRFRPWQAVFLVGTGG